MSSSRKGSASNNPERAFLPKASPYYYGAGYVEPKKSDSRTFGDAQHTKDKRSVKTWMPFLRAPSRAKPVKDDASSRSAEDIASAWGNLFEFEAKIPQSVNGGRNAEGSQPGIEETSIPHSKNESGDDKLRITTSSVATEEDRHEDGQGDIEGENNVSISTGCEMLRPTSLSRPGDTREGSKAADSNSDGFLSNSFAVTSNSESDSVCNSKEAINSANIPSGNVGDITSTESTTISPKFMTIPSFTHNRQEACISIDTLEVKHRKSDSSELASLPSICHSSLSQRGNGNLFGLRCKEVESCGESISSKPDGLHSNSGSAFQNHVTEASISKTIRLSSEFKEAKSVASCDDTMIEHSSPASSFVGSTGITRANFPSDRSHKSNSRAERAKDSTKTTGEFTTVMSDRKLREIGLRNRDSLAEPCDVRETAPIAHKPVFFDNHVEETMDSGVWQSELDSADSIDRLSAWKDRFDVTARSREPVKITAQTVLGENDKSLRRGSYEKEKMSFSGVASAFYNGGSLGLNGTLSCSSMLKINAYLKDRRSELYAGVPGKWLTVVLGGESPDLSTIVSTIMYSYFLTLTTKPEQLCILPLINMARADLALHPEVLWLFKSCNIDTSALLFLDEISLSYYHRFGSLRLVLVNHSKLSQSQENLQDDVEEILDIRAQVEGAYPHVRTVIADQDVGSTCTIISESFAKHHPQLLAGRAVCRLMLAAILLDTANLTAKKSTYRDVSMVTLLLNGAGRFGRNGLFKILKQKSHDVSLMSTNEILRKNFKHFIFSSTGWAGRLSDIDEASVEGLESGWNARGARIGMSSLTIPLSQLVNWESDSVQVIQQFRRSTNSQIFVVVTGYYENSTLFKREVLLVGDNGDLINDVSNFFVINNVEVRFSNFHIEGLPTEMKAFTTEGRRVSRTCIQRIIEDFFLR